MRSILLLAALTLAAGLAAQDSSPDARAIVRKSVELDQTNWRQMQDYTWTARSTERHFDSDGKVKSTEQSAWETVILDGEPYRRMLERDNRPLSATEQTRQQEKLDKETAKLARETPAERQRRLAEYEARRRKDREFLLQIPDAYDLRMQGEDRVDGRDVWVIAGTPKPGYRAHSSDAKALLKIRGKIWIDKSNYQWVKVEAETTDTISFGLFLARMYPGAKLVFEQTPAGGDLWLPKRLYMKGAGRLGLIKKIAMDEEITWSNYRKFQVDSKITPLAPNAP
ncbi:MAG: hypothetical protein ACLP59_30475 [Bryobacteraceae bacterium]